MNLSSLCLVHCPVLKPQRFSSTVQLYFRNVHFTDESRDSHLESRKVLDVSEDVFQWNKRSPEDHLTSWLFVSSLLMAFRYKFPVIYRGVRERENHNPIITRHDCSARKANNVRTLGALIYNELRLIANAVM